MKELPEVACERCFKDSRLREWIRENGTKGRCPWCGARNAYTVPLPALGVLFRKVASIYVPVESTFFGEQGDGIDFLLQEDWEIFSEKIVEHPDNLAYQLATAILKAGLHPKHDVDCPDYTGDFRKQSTRLVDEWHERAEAAITEEAAESSEVEADIASNPEYEDYVGEADFLQVAFEDLGKSYDSNHIFYRARIHEDRSKKERHGKGEMGAPPPEWTPPGRANRAGEPVLYLASDADTALAEKRAWKGAAVALGTMKLCRNIRVVSLQDYELPSSPFFEENLAWKLQLAALFYRLGEELSLPLTPSELKVGTLYRPTQHLCDCVRAAGYDGLEFPSAMGKGLNIVLFNPSDAVAIDVKHVRVTEIQFQNS